MANVLTTASTVTCSHTAPTPGIVSTASSAKLRVKGQPVLLKNSIAEEAISGCGIIPDPNTKAVTCVRVKKVEAGEAQKLTVAGESVMLDTLTGKTDGTINGEIQGLKATAGQQKLTAI